MSELSEVEVDVLRIVRQEVRATPKMIANKMGCSDVYARQLCWRSVKTGHLNRVARGVYELTRKGEALPPPSSRPLPPNSTEHSPHPHIQQLPNPPRNGPNSLLRTPQLSQTASAMRAAGYPPLFSTKIFVKKNLTRKLPISFTGSVNFKSKKYFS